MSDDEATTGDDEATTSDDEATGAALDADQPEIGKGTGEGERGLGVQSGASGGGHPTEPEDGSPERAQSAGK